MLNEKNKIEFFDFLKESSSKEIKDFISSKEKNIRDYLFQSIPKMPILSYDRKTVLDVIYERKDNKLLKEMINIYISYGHEWYFNNNDSIIKKAILDNNKELIKFFIEDIEVTINKEDTVEFFKKSDPILLNYLLEKDAFYPACLTLADFIMNSENNPYILLSKEKYFDEKMIENIKLIFNKKENEVNEILLRIYKRGVPEQSPIIDLFKKIYEPENFLCRSGDNGIEFLNFLVRKNEFSLLESLINENIIPLNIRTSDKKTLWDVLGKVDFNEIKINWFVPENIEKYQEHLKRINEKYLIEDSILPNSSEIIKNKKRI